MAPVLARTFFALSHWAEIDKYRPGCTDINLTLSVTEGGSLNYHCHTEMAVVEKYDVINEAAQRCKTLIE